MKTVGVFLTRKCNMHCSYCNVPNYKINEISLDEWKEAVDIMYNLGIRKINFLGGEPTLYKGFTDLISYIIENYDIELSFTTNGTNYEICKKIIQQYKKNIGIGISIDNMDLTKSISPIKAQKGLEFIDKLEKDDLLKDTKLVCYTVLNKTNLDTIANQIKFFSRKGINSYILPYHWDVNESYVHRKKEHVNAFDNEESFEKLKVLLKTLKELKRQKNCIVNSEEFFDAIEKHIMKLDRHCNGLHELRVNCDGKLMCCCDRNGSVNENYTIFDIKDSAVYEKFLKDRDLDTVDCKGCLWPSVFESELRDNDT